MLGAGPRLGVDQAHDLHKPVIARRSGSVKRACNRASVEDFRSTGDLERAASRRSRFRPGAIQSQVGRADRYPTYRLQADGQGE